MHYEMSLPFKNKNIQLPNNRPEAEQHLSGLRKKLQNDEQYRTDYISFMNGIIEKVMHERLNERNYQGKKEGYGTYPIMVCTT